MKKFLVLLLAAVMVFTCTIALADYPEKAIEIIIPAETPTRPSARLPSPSPRFWDSLWLSPTCPAARVRWL